MGTIAEAVLISTHYLWSKNKKNRYTTCIPQFLYIKVGFKRVYIAQACFPDLKHDHGQINGKQMNIKCFLLIVYLIISFKHINQPIRLYLCKHEYSLSSVNIETCMSKYNLKPSGKHVRAMNTP